MRSFNRSRTHFSLIGLERISKLQSLNLNVLGSGVQSAKTKFEYDVDKISPFSPSRASLLIIFNITT